MDSILRQVSSGLYSTNVGIKMFSLLGLFTLNFFSCTYSMPIYQINTKVGKQEILKIGQASRFLLATRTFS